MAARHPPRGTSRLAAPVLAALNRPFTIDHPTELRTLTTEFATRLATYAERTPPTDGHPGG